MSALKVLSCITKPIKQHTGLVVNKKDSIKSQDKQGQTKVTGNSGDRQDIWQGRWRQGENPQWLDSDYSPKVRDTLKSLKYQRDRDMNHSDFYCGYHPAGVRSQFRPEEYDKTPSSRGTETRSLFARSIANEMLRSRLTGYHYEFDKEVTPKIGSLEKRMAGRRDTILKIGHSYTVDTNQVL